MKVFISWSGVRSRQVAELLDEWLQCVLQAVDPWLSSKDIDRGSLWFTEINNQLADVKIGIVCLTNQNKNAPWILFESGALAKGLSSNKVCTFLIDLSPADVANPLAQFNHTFKDKDSVYQLVRTINAMLEEYKLKDDILKKVFETYYPQFNESFNEIIESTPEEEVEEERGEDEIMKEVLSSVRVIEKRLRSVESKGETFTGGIRQGDVQNPNEASIALIRNEIRKLHLMNLAKDDIFHEIRKLELASDVRLKDEIDFFMFTHGR